jgi:hypothetical protein
MRNKLKEADTFSRYVISLLQLLVVFGGWHFPCFCEWYPICCLETLQLGPNTNDKCTHLSGYSQDAFLHLAHSDPYTPDHHSYDNEYRQLSDPYTSHRRRLESYDRRLCQP